MKHTASRILKLPTLGRGIAALAIGLAAAGATCMPPSAQAAPKKPAHRAKPAADGDKASGIKLYAAQHCDACHKIAGKGGPTGPDLSKTGSKHDGAWFAAFLKSPTSKVPGSKMPPAAGSDKDIKDLAAYMVSLK